MIAVIKVPQSSGTSHISGTVATPINTNDFDVLNKRESSLRKRFMWHACLQLLVTPARPNIAVQCEADLVHYDVMDTFTAIGAVR